MDTCLATSVENYSGRNLILMIHSIPFQFVLNLLICVISS